MKRIKLVSFIFIFMAVSFSCNFVSNLANSGSGPQNLTAELTAPDVVLLTWDAVEGATGYAIEASIDGGESFPIINLSSN